MPQGSLYQPFEGATLLIPSGPDYHLFIVATQPCSEQCVALVNVTSIVPGRPYDQTCVFQGGEHEFIRHPSWVYYRRARILSVAALRLGIRDNIFIPKASVNGAVFENVCDGFGLSPFVTPRVRAYVEAQFSRS